MPTQILVLWTYAFTDHTGFLLQRSVNSASTWPTNVVTTASVLQYTDSDVAVGGTYWYHVAATNPYGTGSFSNTASVYLAAAGPVTISLSVTATSESKAYDGTTSSYQTPIIVSGSVAGGDTASFIQFFTDKLVASDIPISLTGSLTVTSGNVYAVTLVPSTGNILGPSASFEYIVTPMDTDIPVVDGVRMDLTDIADSGSIFVTQTYYGNTDTILTTTSSNCVSWSAVVTNSLQVFSNALAVGGNRIVGIGVAPPLYDATDQYVQYSDDLGFTWTTSSVGGLTRLIFDMIYDGTKFVGCGQDGTIVTSSNGVNWWVSSIGGSSATERNRCLLYEGGNYTVVGADVSAPGASTGTIHISSDLNTWTHVSSSIPTTNGYLSVAYSPSLNTYLAVGEFGLMATSSNGTNWVNNSNAPPIYDITLTNVIWNSTSSSFVAADTNGYIYISYDGVTWDLNKLNPNYLYYSNYYYNVYRMMHYASINKVVVLGGPPAT